MMVLVTSVRDYINRMFRHEGSHTRLRNDMYLSAVIHWQCEHCVFTVRAASERSVLVESMSHLKAVYFIRPTSENIQKLRYQLANPRFGEHHLCTIRSFIFQESRDTQIHILADSDEHEAVQQVQVIFLESYSGLLLRP
ncbi:hypothetical protein YC2023_078562 [Brassica napus]